MRHASARGLALVSSLVLAAGASALQSPAAERLNLGLRGVYFVPNEGQWSDAGVIFGYRARGLDIAFRESSFTMHLAREMPEASPTRERGHWAAHAAAEPSPDREGVVLDERRGDALHSAHAAAEPSPDREGVVLDERWSDALHSAHAAAEPSPDREGAVLDDRWNDALHSAHATAEPSPDREGAVLDERRGDALLSPQTQLMVDPRQPQRSLEHLTLTVTFPGSNEVIPVAAQPRSARFNYFIGDDESKWASNVPSFGEVVYRNLYDGVDLHITGAGARGLADESNADGVLKYEFHVAPGADWSQIRIQYDGIESLCIDHAGSLHIATTFGTLTDAAPLVWQECLASRDGKGAVLDDRSPRPLPDGRGSSDHRDPIPARFELLNDTTYRITLDGPVDPTRELIIDPDVKWMRYLGGTSLDQIMDMARDSDGNYLVTGWTDSGNFEGQLNQYGTWSDAYVSKVSPSGELYWTLFVGSAWLDWGESIQVDSHDHAIVAGATGSTDFPRRINEFHGGRDVFIAYVGPTGQLLWSSYIGGSENDWCRGLVLDGQDQIYLSGTTSSPDFEGKTNESYGLDDGFVARVSSEGAIEWMTFIGGANIDVGGGLARRADGHLILAGGTGSPDLTSRLNDRIGRIDAYLASINPAGELDWTMYLGGTDDESSAVTPRPKVAIGEGGEIYIIGVTVSPDFVGRTN